MMLIDDEPVEAKLVTQYEVIEVIFVELTSLLGVEMRIGDVDPLALRTSRHDVRIRHEVH